jgi:phosphate-selective porin
MIDKQTKYIILIVLVAILEKTSSGQDSIDNSLDQSKQLLSYGKKGFVFQDKTGNYLMNLEFRGQFRLAYPSDTDPISLNDYQKEQVYLGIRRARLKVGGHAYRPWMKYYLEYELFSSNLLDFRIMFEKLPWLKFKLGQWKVQYNRERIISSGKQQTVERSILTRPFTIDRQQGVSVYGNIAGRGAANFNYWISVFMGTGRGSTTNDDDHMMYMMRLQWNPMGRVLKFSGSDLEDHQKLNMLLAIAGVTNQSPYTRFSQSGGGQLEGFEEGEPGQYRVNQLMQETAGKYRGFSWQQEFHYKQIMDNKNMTTTEMVGNLIQAGYFAGNLFSFIPKKIEIYARYAFYFPNLNDKDDHDDEVSLGINWFLSGHRLKLTAETSYLSTGIDSEKLYSGWRYRVQLDISF